MPNTRDLQRLLAALEAPDAWSAMGRRQFEHAVGLRLWLARDTRAAGAFEVKIEEPRGQLYTYNAFSFPHFSQETSYRVLGPLTVEHHRIDGTTFGHALSQQWGCWRKLHALMSVLRQHFGVGRWHGGAVERFYTPEGWAYCPRLMPHHVSTLLQRHHFCVLTSNGCWTPPTSLAWTRGGTSCPLDRAWALQALMEGYRSC